MKMKLRLGLLTVALLAPRLLLAWGYDGHRTVSQLALASLPADFPAFVKTPDDAARIAFLANIPDRWRNVDPWLDQSGGSWTDHYLDIEQLAEAGLDAHTVPSMRLDFAVAFAAGRAAHPDRFPAIDPKKNTDHTREWCGFLPWAIADNFHKLQSAFGYLKAYQDLGGTPEEIANSQADVVYTMGILAHYVGDGAQPLHTTRNHSGWVGPNPNGYTTQFSFHAWIDSGLIGKAKITTADLMPRIAPAVPLALGGRTDGRDPAFVAAMDYVLATNMQVEPLYQLEKDGKLGRGDQQAVAPEGRALVEGQLLKGSAMLASLWTTAWKTAPIDSYLRNVLGERQAAAAGKAPVPAKP